MGTLTDSSVLGEDGTLSPLVKTAVHNLALDDNRFRDGDPSFPPVFMDSKDDRVHEAWFSGEHGDVGGTYYEKGMPDYSCKYMLEWMAKEGITFIEAEDINPECLKVDHFEVDIDQKYLNVEPNPANKLHLNEQQKNEPSFRPVDAVSNNEIIDDATVRIHVSVLDHMKAMKTANTPYAINPNIKEVTNLVVVDSLDTELEAETKEFKELLAF